MSKTIRIINLLISITLLLLFSCTSVNSNIQPPLDFEDEYLNKQVRLFPFSQEDTFKTTDLLDLSMVFGTDTEIVFPNNYNLRLFVLENETWNEINEKPRTRLPEGYFLFSPRTSPHMHVICSS